MKKKLIGIAVILALLIWAWSARGIEYDPALCKYQVVRAEQGIAGQTCRVYAPWKWDDPCSIQQTDVRVVCENPPIGSTFDANTLILTWHTDVNDAGTYYLNWRVGVMIDPNLPPTEDNFMPLHSVLGQPSAVTTVIALKRWAVPVFDVTNFRVWFE